MATSDDVTSMGCAGCGACCEDIWVPEGFVTASEGPPSDKYPESYNVEFARENFVRREGPEGNTPEGPSNQVRVDCKAYDPVAKCCTKHDTRPQICRGFPFYGDDPRGNEQSVKTISHFKRCSFYWDLDPEMRKSLTMDRPLLPIRAI